MLVTFCFARRGHVPFSACAPLFFPIFDALTEIESIMMRTPCRGRRKFYSRQELPARSGFAQGMQKLLAFGGTIPSPQLGRTLSSAIACGRILRSSRATPFTETFRIASRRKAIRPQTPSKVGVEIYPAIRNEIPFIL